MLSFPFIPLVMTFVNHIVIVANDRDTVVYEDVKHLAGAEVRPMGLEIFRQGIFHRPPEARESYVDCSDEFYELYHRTVKMWAMISKYG